MIEENYRSQILSLESKLRQVGHRLALEDIRDVVKHVGWDFDLAATALLMHPRPQWVADIAGAHPFAKVMK